MAVLNSSLNRQGVGYNHLMATVEQQITHEDAPAYVDGMLDRALAAGASDIHVEPIEDGSEIRFRVDGLLTTVEKLPTDIGRSIVLRLMVMAQLLTYRLDIPQEGRIRNKALDLRLAIMPVAHGLRAAIRLPAELTQPRELGALGLPSECLIQLERFTRADGGMLLVTGPAGSGKTTTIYALLEEISRKCLGLSIISLEDPIERHVKGITQIEVAPHGQMTYERALKSILRQDPQVLMLGEIRDVATARVAVQAALSGHRLIATMHAGEPATALARLLEMGIEPYQITSSLFGVLTQRLVRRTTSEGYKGRVPLAEFGGMDDGVRQAVLGRGDAESLRNSFASQSGHATLRMMADRYVTQGLTDAAEVRRVLGE